MADNTTLNVGSSGDVIATDDIGGVKHQRVKIQYGDDGSATDCSEASPLPVMSVFTDGPEIDPFSRLRTSYPETIFDVKQLYDKQPLFFDESITNTSGNATSTHSTLNAATTMYVEANDVIVRQTKMRFNYQPGKGQLCYFTGVLGVSVTDTTRRIGSFESSDGVFFQLDDSILSVVVRKNSSDTVIAQSAWNVDKLDGTGVSGVTVDTSKTQIFVIDYEWLGVGRVRFGFIIDGVIRYCHYSNNANVTTSVYMSTPNHPIRYEIISTGGTGAMDHLCTSIISEGGVHPSGVLQSHSTGSTHIDASAANTVYAVLGARLKTTHLDATVIPMDFSMVSETADNFRWILCINPTIASTFTYGDLDNSACQIATGALANTISDTGFIISQGYSSTSSMSVDKQFESSLRIGSQIDGTRDEIVLAVMPLSANADIQAALNWRELL